MREPAEVVCVFALFNAVGNPAEVVCVFAVRNAAGRPGEAVNTDS